MFCSHCGTVLEDGGQFCIKCGKKLGQAAEKPETEAPQPVSYKFMLNCFGGGIFSPAYVYLTFYEDKVMIYKILSKKMERMIYDYIKEVGKVKKIKLLERTAYRTQYIDDFSKSLPSLSDHELIDLGVDVQVIQYNTVKKLVFQFSKSETRYGADDTHTSKTTGYISFKTQGGKTKYTHAYCYHKTTNELLQNCFGSLIKIYN